MRWLEKHICALKPMPLFQSIIPLFHCYVFAARKIPELDIYKYLKVHIIVLDCSGSTVKVEANFGFGHRIQRFALMELARWHICELLLKMAKE